MVVLAATHVPAGPKLLRQPGPLLVQRGEETSELEAPRSAITSPDIARPKLIHKTMILDPFIGAHLVEHRTAAGQEGFTDVMAWKAGLFEQQDAKRQRIPLDQRTDGAAGRSATDDHYVEVLHVRSLR